MTIKNIRESDRAEYLAMCAEFYGSDAVAHPVDKSHFVNAFNYFIVDGAMSRCFILAEDNKAVGYGILCFGYSQEAGGKTVLFDELYIRREYRGKGFGKAFFKYVFDNFPAARYKLEVDPRNLRAEKLYKNLGFKRLGYNQLIRE